MRPDLTAAEVVVWLRYQARTFANMADTIEATFNLAPAPQPQNATSPVTSSPSPPAPEPENTEKTVQEIKRIMGGRAKRLSDIALAMGRTEQSIEPLLTQANGFIKADRGWYKARTPEDDQEKNGQPLLLTGAEEN